MNNQVKCDYYSCNKRYRTGCYDENCLIKHKCKTVPSFIIERSLDLYNLDKSFSCNKHLEHFAKYCEHILTLKHLTKIEKQRLRYEPDFWKSLKDWKENK